MFKGFWLLVFCPWLMLAASPANENEMPQTASQNKKPARSSSNSDNKIQMREPVKRTNTGKALRRNEIAKKENGAASASPADRMQNGRKRHSHSSNAGQQSTSSAVKAQDKPGIHAQKELSGDAKPPRIAQ